jgi:hypothetical protein
MTGEPTFWEKTASTETTPFEDALSTIPSIKSAFGDAARWTKDFVKDNPAVQKWGPVALAVMMFMGGGLGDRMLNKFLPGYDTVTNIPIVGFAVKFAVAFGIGNMLSKGLVGALKDDKDAEAAAGKRLENPPPVEDGTLKGQYNSTVHSDALRAREEISQRHAADQGRGNDKGGMVPTPGNS